MANNQQPDTSPEAHYKLASLWLLRGRKDLAMAAYRNALELDPCFVPACLAISDMLVKQSRSEEALLICQRAVGRQPDNRLLVEQIRKLKSPAPDQHAETPDPVSGPSVDQGAPDDRPCVLVLSDCAGKDGAEQCNHLILLDLDNAGYRVVCAQPRANHLLIDERMEAGIGHIWIESETFPRPAGSRKPSTRQIESRFATIKPDLVLFSDGSPFSNLESKKVAMAMGLPFIILVHCVNEEWGQGQDALMGELQRAFAMAEEVVSVSQQNLDELRASFSLPATKGKVIYNGRPGKFFLEGRQEVRVRLRRALGIGEDAIVCTTVARMEVMKGYQYLLSAMEHLKSLAIWSDLHFLWIGTGTLENRLRTLAAEIGVDQSISFLGSRNDVEDLLDASDLFALPSQYEGMPLSVIEAMAKGLPVIASRVSGIPEALGSTGFLITDPRRDPSAAADQIGSAIESLAVRIRDGERPGEAARDRARRLFTSEGMLGAYRDLISTAIGTNSRPWPQ